MHPFTPDERSCIDQRRVFELLPVSDTAVSHPQHADLAGGLTLYGIVFLKSGLAAMVVRLLVCVHPTSRFLPVIGNAVDGCCTRAVLGIMRVVSAVYQNLPDTCISQLSRDYCFDLWCLSFTLKPL